MKLLDLLGLGKSKRPWQELVGLRPHMIDESSADGGYGKYSKVTIENRIATVQANGLLVNDEDWWDGWGVSTYGRIRKDVMTAAADPAVDGILLAINSPGGETDLAFETATDLVAAGKKKPLWAVAGTSAYSAGYLLAACASRVYVPPISGGVGSIGVYMAHMDYSEMLENAGVKATFIEAGRGKTDGHPYKPLSASAKEKLTEMVERSYSAFVDHVSAQRGLSPGAIHKLGADLFAGASSIEAGLADKVGDLESARREMREFLDSRAAAAVPIQTTSDAAHQSALALDESVQLAASEIAAGTLTVVNDPVAEHRQIAANKEQILAVCATGGLSAQQAQEFIQAGRTVEDVRAELLERRARASDEHEIVSQLLPHTGGDGVTSNINDSAIVKAADKLAQAQKARK